ncbi:MAG: hypothetical protein IJD71_00675, partial [Clostridia bacterium]|nr:hypothetical protein [Clostridia bacterium]
DLLDILVVWSANHFYYTKEFFYCLLYSSLKAISIPPVEQGVNFVTDKINIHPHIDIVGGYLLFLLYKFIFK